MLRIQFSFHPNGIGVPVGFNMGDMVFQGNRATVTSAGRQPDQSMMLAMSIVQLLDTVRDVISRPRSPGHSFEAIDSSFRVAFRRRHRNQGEISVTSRGILIHVTDAKSLKNDIEQSINEFLRDHDQAAIMDEDEASDFRDSWKRFQEFTVH